MYEANLFDFLRTYAPCTFPKFVGHINRIFISALLSMQVRDHSQTTSLEEVLKSNINLQNAYASNLSHTEKVTRWIELQRSINKMFDSKTAVGECIFLLPSFVDLLT